MARSCGYCLLLAPLLLLPPLLQLLLLLLLLLLPPPCWLLVRCVDPAPVAVDVPCRPQVPPPRLPGHVVRHTAHPAADVGFGHGLRGRRPGKGEGGVGEACTSGGGKRRGG